MQNGLGLAQRVGARLARVGGVRRGISLAELHRAGVVLRPEEAIAITQQLIDGNSPSTASASKAQPPFGPPTPLNVYLEADGSVSCLGCDATLAPSEAAIFLQSILPSGPSGVPGSLRYVLARALLDVDAPPFDSVEEFSRVLARQERGNRAEVVRRLLDRARADLAVRRGEAIAVLDRTPAVHRITEVRRRLRERDARISNQRVAIHALDAMASGARAQSSRPLPLVAGLAIGILLVGAGEALHERYRAPSQAPDQARSLAPADRQLPPPLAELANADSSPRPVGGTAIRSAQLSSKRASRQVTTASHETAIAARARAPRKHSPFGWLRTKIIFRVDPL